FGFPDLTSPADTERVHVGASADAPGFRVLPRGASLMGADCHPVAAGYVVAEYADSSWLGPFTESNPCTLSVRPRVPGTFVVEVRASMHPLGAIPCAFVNTVPAAGLGGTDQQ